MTTSAHASRNRVVDFELGVKYVENSMTIDSPQMRKICDAAAENGISVALGFSERAGKSVYIAQALIGDDGKIMVRRRKMKVSSDRTGISI
jgi:nitrilase